MQSILIVIPARYKSSRLPGKPLIKIAGKTMLQHVVDTALQAAKSITGVEVLVATDDNRILQHAADLKVNAVMTPESCETGTDRIIAAVAALKVKPNAVLNIQGDAPLTPLSVIQTLLSHLQNAEKSTVITPVMQLSWQDLDTLRAVKLHSPFSGTTAIINQQQDAIWFSKQIIPAIRSEEILRTKDKLSPVFQHLGLYGYSLDMLDIFAKLPVGHYEQLEALEQLRFLENGYKIQAIPVSLPNLHAWRGVDTEQDAKFVEEILKK